MLFFMFSFFAGSSCCFTKYGVHGMDQLVLMRRASKESTLQQNPTSTKGITMLPKKLWWTKYLKHSTECRWEVKTNGFVFGLFLRTKTEANHVRKNSKQYSNYEHYDQFTSRVVHTKTRLERPLAHFGPSTLLLSRLQRLLQNTTCRCNNSVCTSWAARRCLCYQCCKMLLFFSSGYSKKVLRLLFLHPGNSL